MKAIKQARIQFRLSGMELERVEAQVRNQNFGSISQYCRALLEKDLEPSLDRHSVEEDILKACLGIERRLEKYFGRSRKGEKTLTAYEKLRNALVATAIMQEEPKKLQTYLQNLFKGDYES